MTGVRLAFKCGVWKPSAAEWILAMSSVQPEERLRIRQFVFRKHTRSALVGRLLARNAVLQQTGLPYHSISLDRTEKGKPFLVNCPPSCEQFDFNISHDGDYAVAAAELQHLVGVDIMQVDRPPGAKNVEQFFSTMSRQLTEHEWTVVKSAGDELSQLATFYRHWCLKESYVKSFGIGIGLSLERLECHIHSPVSDSTVVSDTEIWVDGDVDNTASFEESLLDDRHLVVVCLKQVAKPESSSSKRQAQSTERRFTVLSCAELLESVVSLTDIDDDDWTSYCHKSESAART